MAAQIDIPTTALILALQGTEIRTPRDWMPRLEGRSQPVRALSSPISMVSWWSPDEIRASFEVANAIWGQADIRFHPIQVGRRVERVASNERRIYVDLTNRFGRLYDPNVVVGFVDSLGAGHGGIAGGRLALVAHRRIFSQSREFKGTVLAHELGHVLGLADRAGTNDGNLMYYSHRIGSSRNRDLTASQIGVARQRAERIRP